MIGQIIVEASTFVKLRSQRVFSNAEVAEIEEACGEEVNR